MKIVLCVFLTLSLTVVITPLKAQAQLGLLAIESGEEGGDANEQQTSSQDLQELIRLLSNPALVAQLQQRLKDTVDQPAADTLSVSGLQKYFQGTLFEIEKRAREIVSALSTVPRLSEALSTAWIENMAASDFLQSAIYVIIFLFGGFGLEWLYWCYLSGTLKRIELSKPVSYGRVLNAATLRAVLLFGSIAVFAFGSLGLFVGFEWSAFIEQLILSLLAGIITMRFIVMIAVFVLAPEVDDLRLLPLDKPAAKNIYRWVVSVAGVGLFGYLSVDTIDRMAIEPASLLAVEVLAGLGFTAVLIGAMWQSDSQRRRANTSTIVASGTDAGARVQAPGNFKTVVWSALILVAFILWLLEVDAVMWTLVTLSLLFPAIQLSRVMVDHIVDQSEHRTAAKNMQPESRQDDRAATQSPPPHTRYKLYRPIAIRLMRFLLVIIALLTLGSVWDVTSVMQSKSDTISGKVFGVLIDIVFALLIAEFVWTWAKTAIDQKLSTIDAPVPGHPTGPEARMATLLPMIRKVLMVTIAIMVALIVLSSLGINIGPILAGAGVLGIALGFGAQSLVKDIVSGVFFLIEDAFRVGEYIEVGDLRGTVESVSIRSLRVRHHRGAVHTIPFGELASLTNHSRDWAIMKLDFRVPFDTDIKLIKKIIKKVSAKLQENPDYGHYIIEPLKSQGVRRMEEFNMVVGVKFMAIPGYQFTIRRDAYQQIRDAFTANNIEFAQRHVKVEVSSDRPLSPQEEEAAVSAAQDSIEQQLPAKPLPDEP
jgi:small-conductance mechanosensitive channel